MITALMNLGFRLEQKAEQIAERMTTRSGVAPVSWPAGVEQQSIIYRLPTDREQRASIFAKNQRVLVTDGQSAIVLVDGQPIGALEPGVYSFEKTRVVGSLDVIWVKTGQQMMRWGMGDISTADGVQVRTNGVAYVKVIDGLRFNREVLQGAVRFGEEELQEFLRPKIQSVLRTIIPKWPAIDLESRRDEFVAAVNAQLTQVIEAVGLMLVAFEVAKLDLPQAFKDARASIVIEQHTGNATLIRAAAEAQAKLTKDLTQVQLLEAMTRAGIDPYKMKMLEAMTEMAKNPAQGGVLGVDPRILLTQQMAQMGGLPTTGFVQAAAPVSAALPALAPAALPPPSATSAPAPAASPAVGSAERIAELEGQIDKLVERLSNGEISEDNFNKLNARLEARIAAIRAGAG